MTFFRGDDESEAHSEDAESLAQIEQGGLPRRARERLQALAGDGSLFTSGLSVNEFALLRQAGPQPLAQVMGASVVRTGWQYLPALPPGMIVTTGPWYAQNTSARAWRNPYTDASPAQVRSYQWHQDVVCELETLSDAWNTARRRALDRLSEEALQVGADAVVGVNLHRGEHDLGKGLIDYVVTGTAIRLPGSTGVAWPALSDLSVQDYWRLRRSGYDPVGLIATTAVVFASPGRIRRLGRVRTTASNQELQELSQAFGAARETVRNRLRGQVDDAHGDGAVGVEFSHSVRKDKLAVASALQSTVSRGWHLGRLGLPYFVSGHTDTERRGWAVTMHAAGTAIRRSGDGEPAPVKPMIRLGSDR